MDQALTLNPLAEPVLILNANFEPLHVSNTRRALGLILSGKAEVIINGRGTIHTSHTTFGIPSIIRLSYMIKRPRPKINLSKKEILRRDHHTCQYCGKKSHDLTIDHVKPKHAGGAHSWVNVVAACGPCNRKKGGRTPTQAHMPLVRKPFEPRPSAEYRFNRYLTRREEWAQFLQGW